MSRAIAADTDQSQLGAEHQLAVSEKGVDTALFLAAQQVVDGTFEVPADFHPANYITEGRVYRADEEIEAVVRYSPRIARWIRERGPVEELEDGSVAVRLRVAPGDYEYVCTVGDHAELGMKGKMHVE